MWESCDGRSEGVDAGEVLRASKSLPLDPRLECQSSLDAGEMAGDPSHESLILRPQTACDKDGKNRLREDSNCNRKSFEHVCEAGSPRGRKDFPPGGSRSGRHRSNE